MTHIYHITHVRNLAAIIQTGYLWCDRLRAERAPGAVSIAHQHIKDRRAKRKVPVAVGGTLADYVPFYFAPRSPMLFTMNRGNVEGYSDGQRPVLHLVSTVENATCLDKPWAFTDGHAEMAISTFHTDLNALDTIVYDEVMEARYWNDTLEDNDRKRRRQAEFLVHQSFPWTAIGLIGVRDDAIRARVEAEILHADHKPKVKVETDWYY